MRKRKEQVGFKVRHTKTGLYLTNIYKNKWSKIGKVWARESDMVRSINMSIKNIKSKKTKYSNFSNDMIEDIVNWEIIMLSEKNNYPALFLLGKIKS
tara:strand:+ start:144 stop:434 length:291 start_codon:yes stop_codon:yes gene_type:complete